VAHPATRDLAPLNEEHIVLVRESYVRMNVPAVPTGAGEVRGLKTEASLPDQFPSRAVGPKFRRIVAGSVLMSVGLVVTYFISYWTYYQGFTCSEPCLPESRIGIPYFSGASESQPPNPTGPLFSGGRS
jgi:hypothetical protein